MKFDGNSENMGGDYILCSRQKKEEFFLHLAAFRLAERVSEEGLIFVVLFGGTGSGKSSLLNFLGERRLSQVSVVRPCTRIPCFVVPDSVDCDLTTHLSDFLGPHGFNVERADIAGNGRMVLVDCPDYDSVSEDNRRQAAFLFTLADLLCLVLSPVKYADEGALYWKQRISEEKAGGLVFITKTDTLKIGALEEVRESVGGLFPESEALFVSVQNPASGLRQRIIDKINKFPDAGFLQESRRLRKARMRQELAELVFICKEQYNQRAYLLSGLEKSSDDIETAFYERQQLLQEKILSDLRQRLDRIAEDKLFYISRWFVRNLGSLIGKIGSHSRLSAGTEIQDPDEKWAREILDNLLLALHQTQVKQEALAVRHDWFQPAMIDEELFCHEFMHSYRDFATQARQQIAESFARNVSTRHSVVAVSQEVFLSMAFYFLLGPIGIFPGWEQMFSGIMYLIYGKVPAGNQPSVFMEVRKLSEKYQQEFRDFLFAHLQKIREPLQLFLNEQQKNKENWESWRVGMEKFLSD